MAAILSRLRGDEFYNRHCVRPDQDSVLQACQWHRLLWPVVPEKRLPSLDHIFDEVRQERAAQLRHFDALDVKAGIVLGFAGALVALAPAASVLADVGRFVAVVSGLFAVAAFWPRPYGATDLRMLRDVYLPSEPLFTRVHLLDAQIAIWHEAVTTLRGKVFLLRVAIVMLLGAAALTAIGLAID